MTQRASIRLAQITVHVRDCDEACRWYVDNLGWIKRQDETYADGTRWVTVSAPDQPDVRLVLDKRPQFAGDNGVGKQPVLIVATDDCVAAYEQLLARGVRIKDPPIHEVWGTTARFYDLYGNEIHMFQPSHRT
ncbi:MAG: VOC family protein [Alphaproteobacteria bacterium]|nr:VOC family protein [Alphaproteobacteria bacterium]